MHPGSLENGGADMLLMTRNTRSGGVSQARPQGAAPAVGAQRRALTDAGAEGTRPPRLRTCGLAFATLSAARDPGLTSDS